MNLTLANSTLHILQSLFMNFTSTHSMCMQIINFFIGLPLNLAVIILIVRAGGLEGPVVFTLNLAVSEILLALCTPVVILCYANGMIVDLVRTATLLICICFSCRLYFPVCLCLERYLAVVHPVTFLKYKSMTYRLVISLALYVCSLIEGILLITTCLTMPYIISALSYAVILSIYAFCFISVLRVLTRPRPGERDGEASASRAAKQKASKVVLCNLLIFLIQTIPLAVVLASKDVLDPDVFSMAFSISVDLNVAGGLLQPVLFFYQIGQLTFTSCF